MKKTTLSALIIMCIFHGIGQEKNRMLTPAQMQQDLSVLQSAWTNLHPGLYRYNTPEQIQGYFQTLKTKCSRPLDERVFYIALAQLAEKIKCGHTYLNPLNLDAATKKRMMPERVVPLFFQIVEGKKIIVTHNVSSSSSLQRGDEITAVNGIPAQRIIDSLLTVSRSDGRNAIGKKLNNINETPDEATAYSLFDIFFPLFFPPGNEYFVIDTRAFVPLEKGIVPGKKKQNAVTGRSTVMGVSLQQRITLYEEIYGKVPVAEGTWGYKLLDEQTAYMKFGTFAFWNSKFNEQRFVDSVFADLYKRKQVKNLIIDIRGNEGGDNTGDYILSYITKKKIGCDDPDRACYRYLKIPDTLLPHLSTWDNSFKKPKDPAKYTLNELGLYERKTKGEDCSYIIPKQNGFTGYVYLLTDAKNSSAGYEMARNFHVAKLGKIVGETTGGSQQGINGGEFFFLTLPNSKFEIDLPLIYSYHAGKEDAGITPGIKISTTQAGIAEHKDEQVSFVLHMSDIKRKQ